MKVLFAGPSLAGDLADLGARHGTITFAGPVARGDVVQWTRRGASAIGIVDGLFHGVPPVWHKEILFALSQGVAVAGGASMGALRAAECSAFGMVGLGDVYRLYCEGTELDDAAVAQVHAPAELGWTALSEASVTVQATIAACESRALVTPAEAVRLHTACRSIFHTERTLDRVAAAAIEDTTRRAIVAAALTANRLDIKRSDGLLVAEWLAAQPDERGPQPKEWRFAETGQWRTLLAELARNP